MYRHYITAICTCPALKYYMQFRQKCCLPNRILNSKSLRLNGHSHATIDCVICILCIWLCACHFIAQCQSHWMAKRLMKINQDCLCVRFVETLFFFSVFCTFYFSFVSRRHVFKIYDSNGQQSTQNEF